ncbi:MAG: portal protein [Methylocystis sp.]
MDTRAKELVRISDDGFSARTSLVSWWQECAEQFYPMRADFMATNLVGRDFVGNLMDATPVLAARDLKNLIASMLRPNGSDGSWLSMTIDRQDKLEKDLSARRWLEWATGLQRRAMYDRVAQLRRASDETDGDYAVFGQGVLGCPINMKNLAFAFKNHHLRDTVWFENAEGLIDQIFVNLNLTVRQAEQLFPKKLAPQIYQQDILTKDPNRKIAIRHCVVPSEFYAGAKKYNMPFVSIFVDVENQHVIQERGSWTKRYCIPRWQTVSGSQYAYAPSVVAATPDARLIQAISLTLLEAGEKSVNPPILYPEGVLRDDLQLMAGGATPYDPDYDVRTGQIVTQVLGDRSNLQFGLALHERAKDNITKAFMLDKLSMAPLTKEMTAYEVSKHIEEFVRNAQPLFGPTEPEYNGQLCEMVFDELLHAGAFGPPEDIPQSLRGDEVKFVFESPFHRSVDRQNVELFMQGKQLLAEAVALDPSSAKIIDVRKMLRLALTGSGIPSDCIYSDDEMAEMDAKDQQMQQAQQLLGVLGQGAEVAKNIGEARQALQV